MRDSYGGMTLHGLYVLLAIRKLGPNAMPKDIAAEVNKRTVEITGPNGRTNYADGKAIWAFVWQQERLGRLSCHEVPRERVSQSRKLLQSWTLTPEGRRFVSACVQTIRKLHGS